MRRKAAEWAALAAFIAFGPAVARSGGRWISAPCGGGLAVSRRGAAGPVSAERQTISRGQCGFFRDLDESAATREFLGQSRSPAGQCAR